MQFWVMAVATGLALSVLAGSFEQGVGGGNADEERASMDDMEMLAREWVEISVDRNTGRRVLRPSSYNLPPTRGGRRWLDLSAPGYAAAKSLGPSDKMEAKDGSWSFEDGELTVDAPGWAGTYRVEEITEDKLVLTPK